MLFDLHVHNEGQPGLMLEHAKALGLDGVAFTGAPDFADLDSLRDAAREAEFKALVGCSIETNRGVLLCFFPEPEAIKSEPPWIESKEDGLPSAMEVIQAVQARDGVTIAAHPYYKQVAAPMGDHIFSLEGLNACEAASPLATGMQRDLAIEASESLSLPCVGGSSARTEEHIGLACTYFVEPVENEADLVRLIRERKCVAFTSLEEIPEDAQPSTPTQPRSQEHRRHQRRGRRPQRHS